MLTCLVFSVLVSDTTLFVGVCLCSVIEVSSPDLAKKTIEVMHRADIRGRQIIVREASYVNLTDEEFM